MVHFRLAQYVTEIKNLVFILKKQKTMMPQLNKKINFTSDQCSHFIPPENFRKPLENFLKISVLKNDAYFWWPLTLFPSITSLSHKTANLLIAKNEKNPESKYSYVKKIFPILAKNLFSICSKIIAGICPHK